MAREMPKITVLDPEDGDHGRDDEARRPEYRSRLRRSGARFRQIRKPEVDRGIFSSREAYRLFKQFFLNWLEQEIQASLRHHGYVVSTELEKELLSMYDLVLKELWETYVSGYHERTPWHNELMLERFWMGVDRLTDFHDVSLQGLNERLVEVVERELSSGEIPGWWERLLGG
jgi:hypothetical protein